MSAAVVAAIAASLAKGLLSGIGSAIGARIFNDIFPAGVPSYFTEVYKKIEKIVHQEITQNTIDEINGEINGLKDWVKNVYTPRKEFGASKQELYKLIQPKESDIAIHMISILQQQSFAELSLSVFVIGASIHLVILQELSLVDPEISDPSSSSYVASIKRYASEYADFAMKTYENILKKRTSESTITTVSDSSMQWPHFPGQPLQHITFSTKWKDNFTGEEFSDATDLINMIWTNGTLPELLSRSGEKRTQYIAKVKDQLNKDLNDPTVVSAAWRQLIGHPLPDH